MPETISSVLGHWTDWLMYNVGRSIDPQDSELRATGAEQVKLCLVTVSRLQNLAEDMLSIVSRQVKDPCSI